MPDASSVHAGGLTLAMTQFKAQEASAPGKTYLFMLPLRSIRVSQLPNQLSERSRHDSQETPVEILKLPTRPDPSDLEHEDTIVLEQVVNLVQEGRVPPDSNVFGHFERDNLVELASLGGEVSEVGAENSTLRRFDAVLSETLVTERGLLLGKGD